MKNSNNKESQNKKKPSVMRLVLLFMLLCIICSFLLNLLLFTRLSALKKKLKSLETSGRACTEQIIQEVGYEFI